MAGKAVTTTFEQLCSFLCGQGWLCSLLIFEVQAPDQMLVIYTAEIRMAQAGIWLLAHCVLYSAQGNHVENGLNGAEHIHELIR